MRNGDGSMDDRQSERSSADKDVDFRSTASVETLKARAQILRKARAFFDAREFVEVQTPLLSADTVVDRHLDPVPVLLPSDPFDLNVGRKMWLQSSPEFAMKRLLASGMDAIYQVTPAFRVGESGDRHNPEFTMLEWYRCGDTIEQGMALLSEFAREMLGTAAATIETMSGAFQRHAQFDPLTCDANELKSQCDRHGINYPDSIRPDDWDTWFDLLFSTVVQPKLGTDAPTIVRDYPASQAALAQVRHDPVPVAERFELFVDGLELANGYLELLDAEELRSRNQTANQQRVLDGKSQLPDDSRLLKAMDCGLPPCVGVALGFDRLVMSILGVSRLSDVVSFTVGRA